MCVASTAGSTTDLIVVGVGTQTSLHDKPTVPERIFTPVIWKEDQINGNFLLSSLSWP